MSKYTTEVRFICENAIGASESVGYNDVERIVSNAREKIFDFDYPIFDENYREVIEKKILKHYYTREIGEETVGLWKLRLGVKMNEIMPYYNQLYKSELIEFNPLYATDLSRNHVTKSNSNSENQTQSNSLSVGDSNGHNSGSSLDTYSDTPQGTVGNLEDLSYLTNARKIDDTADSSGHSSNVSNGEAKGNAKIDSTEAYLEHVSGYEGINASKLLQDYRNTFLNIDMMIINDLEVLFMQLW